MSPTALPSKYYSADGRYLPGANDSDLLAEKEAIFERVAAVHEELTQWQDAHNSTKYGCLRAGKCCQVGLVLHTAEIEFIARNLKARFAEDPDAKPRVIKALKKSLTDEEWSLGEGIGDLMCAFYQDGCTIYPYRPSVCRMYGVVLEINDDCPRRRLASGREFVWIHEEADATIRRLYEAVDDYGELFPRADCSRYLASGLLMFLLPRKEVEKIRARTDPKFWRTLHGYRTQFESSSEKPAYEERVPKIPVRLLSSH